MELKTMMKSFTIIDRESFLRTALTPYVPFALVEEAVVKGIHKTAISHEVIQKIADERIQKYSIQAGTGSFLTNMIGGFLMIPLDYAQFFSNSAMLIQELYYLYGIHSNRKLQKKEDVEMLFYMMIGASATVKTTGSAMSSFAKYMLKKTGKKSIVKVVPAVGCISSSGFSYLSLRSIAYEFIEQLQLMKEQHICKDEPLNKQIEEFIDVEYKEAETAFKQFCNLQKMKELKEYVKAGYLSDEEFKRIIKEDTAGL